MTRFIGRRLLATIPVIFGLSIVLFAFVHLLPGDPAETILGQRARPELVAEVRERLGLDKPLIEQYVQYLGQIARLDFGTSYVNNRPVVDEFLYRFPATVELAVAALILAIGIGVPLGRFAAKRVRSPADATTTVISLIGVSLPVFVLGMILQFVFAVQLGVLPATGRIDQRLAADLQHITGFLLVDTLLQGRLDLFADASRHLILPAITLASIPLAIITRITRASVLDVSSEDYIRTARAKGLSEGRINQRHLLRNAWPPILTVIGIQVGILLGGAVITETVFAWNGVGRWVVDAIKGKDYFVVQATVLFFALMFLVVNLVVDVLYGVANPQIRYER